MRGATCPRSGRPVAEPDVSPGTSKSRILSLKLCLVRSAKRIYGINGAFSRWLGVPHPESLALPMGWQAALLVAALLSRPSLLGRAPSPSCPLSAGWGGLGTSAPGVRTGVGSVVSVRMDQSHFPLSTASAMHRWDFRNWPGFPSWKKTKAPHGSLRGFGGKREQVRTE